jgi:phosphoribosylglycinamide formyltransferase-1
MVRIAVLASGSGSNAEVLVRHFRHSDAGEVVLVGCDRPGAYVLQRAWGLGVPSYLFDREDLATGRVEQEMTGQRIDLIVLAGFLRLIPPDLLRAFPDRIINIHPSLLPRHGGKGMYGARVHAAVLEAGDAQSGITVHRVNEEYDRGEVLFQATCPVRNGDTADTLAERVHALEHAHYPEVVEKLCTTMGPLLR